MAVVGGFHVPNGPEVGRLRKIIPNREAASRVIEPFLIEGENYVWDGPYNTKDELLATKRGQSMGRIFVTNLRLLLWSDDSNRPQAGIFYDDIAAWRTSWMPMKSRAVFLTAGGREFLFAANSTAIEHAETFIEGAK